MKNRGFTLVELLAVLVLVAAIALISVPSIINYINESKTEISEVTEKLILSGAELYVDANKNDFKTTQKQYCVTLQEIVDAKYLSAPILDSVSGEEVSLSTHVKIDHYYNFDKENYDYKYEISNECTEQQYICSAVTENTVTAGNIPSGNYEAGDEYVCQMSKGTLYHFFVLKTDEDNNIKLLMDQNLGGAVAWAESGDNSEGPVTANEALADRTSGWTTLASFGGTVELPSGHDVMGANAWSGDIYSGIQGPNWITTNLSDEGEISAYWTTDIPTGSSDSAWYVADDRYLYYIFVEDTSGIRPVITMPKSKIKN